MLAAEAPAHSELVKVALRSARQCLRRDLAAGMSIRPPVRAIRGRTDLILTHTEESRQAARVFGPTLLVGVLFSRCWAKLTGRL
jgi:hypothetical protein